MRLDIYLILLLIYVKIFLFKSYKIKSKEINRGILNYIWWLVEVLLLCYFDMYIKLVVNDKSLKFVLMIEIY